MRSGLERLGGGKQCASVGYLADDVAFSCQQLLVGTNQQPVIVG
jgi:hypothetical protein